MSKGPRISRLPAPVQQALLDDYCSKCPARRSATQHNVSRESAERFQCHMRLLLRKRMVYEAAEFFSKFGRPHTTRSEAQILRSYATGLSLFRCNRDVWGPQSSAHNLQTIALPQDQSQQFDSDRIDIKFGNGTITKTNIESTMICTGNGRWVTKHSTEATIGTIRPLFAKSYRTLQRYPGKIRTRLFFRVPVFQHCEFQASSRQASDLTFRVFRESLLPFI